MVAQQGMVDRRTGGIVDIISGILGHAETVDFNTRSDVFEAERVARSSLEPRVNRHVAGHQLNHKNQVGFATYTRRASVAYHSHSSVGGRLNTRI